MTATIAPTTNGESQSIHIPQLELRTVRFRLVGTAPLIMHAWSEKAKSLMRDKQQKKASRGKAVRDPEQDYLDSMYVIDRKKGIYGFPAIAFKAAAVNAAVQVDAKKTHMRSSFHIVNGETTNQGTLVPIKYSKIVQREDMVRIGMGVADMRYRAEFQGWSADLDIRYNARMISLEQLIALFNAAGFGIGVGEWRPEKDGMNGTFSVGEIYDAAK